jgi:hypothetical protein
MTQPFVHIQIAPTSVPSTPSWLGEVAVLAHVFSRLGLQKAIEERVRFARARMGDYEVIDFVVMLMGYALSGEPTLEAFYQRLLPFAGSFMALFGRAKLPHPATLSRFLAALDQGPVEALRTLCARRSGGTICVRFPARRGVGSTGSAVDRDGS